MESVTKISSQLFSLPAAALCQIYWNLLHTLQFWDLKELRSIYTQIWETLPPSPHIHTSHFLLSKIFLSFHSHSGSPRLHYLIPWVALCCSDWGVPSVKNLLKNRCDPVWFPFFENPLWFLPAFPHLPIPSNSCFSTFLSIVCDCYLQKGPATLLLLGWNLLLWNITGIYQRWIIY